MAKWLSQRRSASPSSDTDGSIELADRMRRWAEQFAADWRGSGGGLSWDPADAYQLDRLCDSIVRSNPSSDQLVHVAACLGSFVGEIVRRSVGGSWRIVDPPHGVALDLPSGVTEDPFVPAHLRLQPGSTTSLQVWISAVLVHQWKLGKRNRTAAMTPLDRVRQAAKDFTVLTAAGGDVLGWTEGDAAGLEQWCVTLLTGHPSVEVLKEWLPTLGAYLGELLVRCGGGRWEDDEAARRYIVVMPNGTRAFPLDQAEYRLRYGAEHNLKAYVRRTLLG
jgi:hypothetical protein